MMKVIGDRGEIEIHMPPANIRLIDDTRHAHSNPETSHSPVILKQSALAAEIEYFLGCIMRDEIPSIVTPAEAFRALSSAVRIDESSEEIR